MVLGGWRKVEVQLVVDPLNIKFPLDEQVERKKERKK